jgi:ABC-2 type transport system permease protein
MSAITSSGPVLSFGGILRSEWIKLRSVRSTFWCYLIIVVLTILLALLIASGSSRTGDALPHDLQQAQWVQVTTLGINFSQLVVAVLGALVVTGEYGTGMIRSTFAAVPRRYPAMLAKAIVFGVVTFVVSFVSLAASAAIVSPLLRSQGVDADFGDGKVWLALAGGAGYLALIGIISLGIGLLLRNSAAGIAVSLALLLVLPVIFRLIYGFSRAVWAANTSTFLPSNAGGTLYTYPLSSGPAVDPTLITLNGWEALLVVFGWFVVIFAAGIALLQRRDA